MFKRSLSIALLAIGVVSAVAASPLIAADESQLQLMSRVGQNVRMPHGPDPQPIATPTGDDDMPDNTIRPQRTALPITEAAPEPSRVGWLKSLWAQWLEFKSRSARE